MCEGCLAFVAPLAAERDEALTELGRLRAQYDDQRARANANAEAHFAALKTVEAEKKRADEDAAAFVRTLACITKERDFAREAFAVAESSLFDVRQQLRSAPSPSPEQARAARAATHVHGAALVARCRAWLEDMGGSCASSDDLAIFVDEQRSSHVFRTDKERASRWLAIAFPCEGFVVNRADSLAEAFADAREDWAQEDAAQRSVTPERYAILGGKTVRERVAQIRAEQTGEEEQRPAPPSLAEAKYQITYFKTGSGKYYTTDEVTWPTDAPDHSGFNPIASLHRIKTMHAVCMVAPHGFPQFSQATDDLRTCTGCGVREEKTPERTLFGGLCGKCDEATPDDADEQRSPEPLLESGRYMGDDGNERSPEPSLVHDECPNGSCLYGVQSCASFRLPEPLRSQDEVYAERDRCVALIARLAHALGFRVGLGEHPAEDTTWEADWRTIVFVDLPSGQISWHIRAHERAWFEGLPPYAGKWDGHSTEEKYRRVLAPRLLTSSPDTYPCPGCMTLGEAYDTLHDASDKALEGLAALRAERDELARKLATVEENAGRALVPYCGATIEACARLVEKQGYLTTTERIVREATARQLRAFAYSNARRSTQPKNGGANGVEGAAEAGRAVRGLSTGASERRAGNGDSPSDENQAVGERDGSAREGGRGRGRGLDGRELPRLDVVPSALHAMRAASDSSERATSPGGADSALHAAGRRVDAARVEHAAGGASADSMSVGSTRTLGRAPLKFATGDRARIIGGQLYRQSVGVVEHEWDDGSFGLKLRDGTLVGIRGEWLDVAPLRLGGDVDDLSERLFPWALVRPAQRASSPLPWPVPDLVAGPGKPNGLQDVRSFQLDMPPAPERYGMRERETERELVTDADDGEERALLHLGREQLLALVKERTTERDASRVAISRLADQLGELAAVHREAAGLLSDVNLSAGRVAAFLDREAKR
jgi:hypothetical protein